MKAFFHRCQVEFPICSYGLLQALASLANGLITKVSIHLFNLNFVPNQEFLGACLAAPKEVGKLIVNQVVIGILISQDVLA